MQTQKRVIVFYGDTHVSSIYDNCVAQTSILQDSEVFIVQEHHKEEVPREYYHNPEEYYRLKFKKQGFDVKLQACYDRIY